MEQVGCQKKAAGSPRAVLNPVKTATFRFLYAVDTERDCLVEADAAVIGKTFSQALQASLAARGGRQRSATTDLTSSGYGRASQVGRSWAQSWPHTTVSRTGVRLLPSRA